MSLRSSGPSMLTLWSSSPGVTSLWTVIFSWKLLALLPARAPAWASAEGVLCRDRNGLRLAAGGTLLAGPGSRAVLTRGRGADRALGSEAMTVRSGADRPGEGHDS